MSTTKNDDRSYPEMIADLGKAFEESGSDADFLHWLIDDPRGVEYGRIEVAINLISCEIKVWHEREDYRLSFPTEKDFINWVNATF
jgi:hypothetical protein